MYTWTCTFASVLFNLRTLSDQITLLLPSIDLSFATLFAHLGSFCRFNRSATNCTGTLVERHKEYVIYITLYTYNYTCDVNKYSSRCRTFSPKWLTMMDTMLSSFWKVNWLLVFPSFAVFLVASTSSNSLLVDTILSKEVRIVRINILIITHTLHLW